MSDVKPEDRQFETKRLTRCLAALAILRASGCTPAEAGKSVCDGTGDNGIDAIFYDASASEVIVVQSKWIQSGTGEPSLRDIQTFAEGVSAIIDQKPDGFDKRIHPVLASIFDALISVGTTIKILVVSTGAQGLAAPALNRLNKLVDAINGPDGDQKLATFEVIGLSEVYSQLAKGTDHRPIDIELNILDWSFLRDPFGGYWGTVDGVQLKNLWAQFGKRLVTKNIRNSLGSTEVNEGIRQTASKDPDRFWYYNNGITFVADEASRAPATSASQRSGVFLFSGASIVNGAQTVSSLASVEDDASLGKVRVATRVIILKNSPSEFGDMVTRTNNLQNRVEGRDFVKEDPEQHRLQTEMRMENVDYQFLRGEPFTSSATACELPELITALACASGDASLAVLAKTAIGRFYADIKRAPYKSVINSSVTGARAFNAVVVQRHIDAVIDERRKALGRKSGSNFGVLVHGNRVLAAAVFEVASLNLEQPIADFAASLNRTAIEEAVDELAASFVTVVERDYQNRFLAVLFKSPTESRTLLDNAVLEYRLS